MAKKKNTIPGGFENILNGIYDNAEQGSGITDVDDIVPSDTVSLDEGNEIEPPVETEDGKEEDGTPTSDNEVNKEDIPDNVLEGTDNNISQNSADDQNDISQDDITEAQQVGLLFDAVGQSFGWNMDDIEEKDRPLTVNDLTNYLTQVVQQNSVPQYADERIQQLDEYVKNGGKFEEFYGKQQEVMSLDNLDMEDEINQKAVIKELLKQSNYTDEQINKKISRYEDADMLYEESEDALERLKEIKKFQIEEANRVQQELIRQQEEQNRMFFESISNEINSLSTIRGIAIPKEDRRALFDYIFKVDNNGMSQYQKDFNENISKNLIESAYFTMKADTLISNAKKNGESSAAEKLRNLLRHSNKNHSTYNVDDKQKSVTDLLAGAF